ncbi:MAG: hypothetical protein HQM13_12750 [SAR324 cluster bacterium]|nr:hypothetical protein [SAR324 cluster bacterium]
MANTQKLSREDRKKAKNQSRRELKKMIGELSKDQRKKWKKSGQGIKAFLAENKSES